MTALHDPKAEAVLARLHARGDREFKALVRHYLVESARHWLRGRRYTDPDMDFLRDKLIPLDPIKAQLCYLLCRALGARRVVEVGTSFGVSTIYLAAALRDNAAAGEAATGGATGIVIGTEIEPTKAAAARANLAEAGLDGFAEIREGDALETLRDAGGPVDFVLIDTWIPLARPALALLAPQMRPGAMVLCDNVKQFAKAYRDYTDYVRDPANGFRSLLWPHKGGAELSVRA
jgi:predicted O-methyltransferase YrrM